MNKYTKSKSSLFLMELILTILMFSLCGAVCMKMFAASHQLEKKTWELNKSVAVAQGFAEVMRGTDGSVEEILKIFPEAVRQGEASFEIFYDDDFNKCGFKEAVYVGQIEISNKNEIECMKVRISRQSNHEEIYSLEATRYVSGRR